MALRPDLQAAAIAAWPTHGPHDHGDGWQSQLHYHQGKRQKKQVTSHQERRPTGICPGASSLQHLGYIYDLPATVSRKYAYADDLGIMHADRDWHAVEGVAYLGFPTPGGKVSLGASTQSVCGSTDTMNELGVQGRRKLNWTSHIVVSRLVWKFHITVTSRNWRQNLWILEIVKLSWRIESFRVEPSITLKFRSRLITVTHSNCRN